MTYSAFPARLALTTAIITALTACGGGSSDNPDPQDAPTPDITAAEINGSVIKGTLANAVVTPSMLNNTVLHVVGNTTTTDTGDIETLSLTTDPGFGINGILALAAVVGDDSSMICDASQCGSQMLGDVISAENLGSAQLKTLHWIAAPYANEAGGDIEASLQVNALTTFASALIEQGIAAGKNLTSKEAFETYQVERSSRLLRILGIDRSNANVFNETVFSAESSANLTAESEWTQTLSVLNGVFAQFEEGSTLAASLAETQADIVAADVDNDLAIAQSLRQKLIDALQRHEVVTDLGWVAEEIIDLNLPLISDRITLEALTDATPLLVATDAVVTARQSIGDAENEQKVFDGDSNTKWLDDGGVPSIESPSWIQVDYAEPVAINALTITSANDAQDRDPENFHVQGSLDGENWVTLADFSGVAFDARFQTQAFPLNNFLAYSAYRINITKNRGDDGMMQLADMSFFGTLYESENHGVAEKTLSARAAISDNETEAQVFDGNTDTKWLDNGGVPTLEEPSWLEVRFEEAKAVRQLLITSANDAPDRDPENMTLKGSNDGGTTWVTVGTVQGAVFEARFERQAFDLSNELAFSAYRLEVTKNLGDGGMTQIGEVELVGPTQAATNQGLAAVAIEGRAAISDAESADMAFDGDTATKWLDNGGAPSAEEPSWIAVQLPEAQAVNMIALTSANDASSRDPENLTLQGSSDGETWENIGAVEGITFETRAERQAFSLPNPLAYEWYRLNITKNLGDDGFMQVAEIELIGPNYAGADKSDVAGASITARAFIGDAESPEQAFDGTSETKWLDDGGVPTVEEPSWVQVELPQAEAVTALAITSANDAESRDPENFALLGSSDGENWTQLAQWSGEMFDSRFERRLFPLVNGKAYRFYRLDITKNRGDDGMMQVGEIELMGY